MRPPNLMQHHTLTLVVNQAAGGLLDGSITPEDIAERLGDAGFEVDLLSGSPAGIRERLERAVEMPSNVIVVAGRSEEHTSELQSLMRISYAVFCLKKKKKTQNNTTQKITTDRNK